MDMRNILKCIIMTFMLSFSLAALSQNVSVRETYKVKKKDTVYGIAHKFGISIDELLAANPGATDADFNLKKGMTLNIPFPKTTVAPANSGSSSSQQAQQTTKSKYAVTVGVMLPLHNNDGDGRRMLEYYRGVLMACDSMHNAGISTAVYAWNVAADKNIDDILSDKNAKACDIIFGPLYTTQVAKLADFCKRNRIKLVIPFSIGGNDVATNPNVFQIYQSQTRINTRAVDAFLERFHGKHIVFVDCNDTTSTKGPFTQELRKRLDAMGLKYSITNLKSSEANFAKAFSSDGTNVVVLNTGRSPELNIAFAKLNSLRVSNPSLKVSMYGYTEWLMYTKVYLELFHKYDTYIPTTFYYNPVNTTTSRFETLYREHFRSDMQQALPRFAITGFDHAQFFIRGMKKYGEAFSGMKSQVSYTPVQTGLKFERATASGGMQNCAFMLIHYKNDGGTETINY